MVGAREAVDDRISTADILTCIIVVAEVVGDATTCYEWVLVGGSPHGQH